jgi:oxygen-independent coproporphyrinogen-3 oxidase
MVSVGVESLSDRLLKLIGRSHNAAVAEDAVIRAVAEGFDTVSADMMFALPTQTLEELDRDLERVLTLGASQVSTYPIFTFPYTELGRRLEISRIRRPRDDLIRDMLVVIRRRAFEHGLARCSVWSFGRPGRKKFTSTTRHHYIGIGPSAASMLPGRFFVNTFSIEQYAAALPHRLPVALAMPVDQRLEMLYWLYWRIYEMSIPVREFSRLFGRDLESVYGAQLSLLAKLGILSRENGCYRVTEGSAYWVHRLQNEYALNYINRLWGACRNEAWPSVVTL